MSKTPMRSDNPFSLFDTFYRQALTLPLNEPTAMALATSCARGRPSVRIVLLKRHDPEGGFVFFTNKESRKGEELAENPCAALCFHRDELERQVRIEGMVSPLSDAENDVYFAGRARLSKLGAWASAQSRPLGSMEELEDRVCHYDTLYAGKEPPRPSYWGGFRLIPDRMEFWRNAAGRLHERRLFTRSESSALWEEILLCP